ncbi:LacI family DNA-binding transcriptional regulator [Mucilaginibacter auburnensis]|uniref:LacI family transcriptional regulator n=1 Tax=Mucilaginibacter auburnensis TaxID=1457233 RepID=A0A2H9VW63_9SPHI|nr:LacI family DNA-binding transcriptional regulator [Mucilaginibacter auburnensis]PJJ85060.1 LacI family transcriptional regulator [Mucilaginibacter auburnensis]
MKPQVTLKRISEMLNISISTVSRALKDHPDISETTRRKVQELAQMLEYEPNAYAISLRTNNSKEFGVILPDISNHFYLSFIASLEEEARRYGYSLIILQSGNDQAIERDNVKRCRFARVAGVFISVTAETEDIKEMLKMDEQNIPVIFCDKVPAFEACNKVCVADEQATHLAAAELLKKNKKNILAIFGDAHLSITQIRMLAFTAYMSEHNASAKYTIIHAANPQEAATAVQKAMKARRRPDAIFSMSDDILTGVMRSIQRSGLRFPDDIGLIAISDGYLPGLYYPEITYVETSGYKLGKLAFNRMMSCLSGSLFARTLIADAVLVPGGSL